jgi:hypothetical protein
MGYDRVIIDGVDYTTDEIIENGSFIVAGSISCIDTIEVSKSASFKMKQLDNYININKFMTVEIYRFNVKIFAGFIWQVKSTTNAWEGIRELTINCVGNEYLAKKTNLVAKAYTADFYNNVREMIIDLHGNYLVNEGVTLGLIEGLDIPISSFTFNYISPYDCFDLICKRTNMIWYINENKQLFFVNRNTIFSNLKLRWDSRIINYDTLTVSRYNDKYRNKQYSVGGRIVTSTIEEIQSGDGSKKTFTMPFPLAELPKVFVNRGSGYIEENVGFKSEDLSTNQWFYEYDSNLIIQGDGQAVLLLSDLIKVEFKGLVPTVIVSKNEEEILIKKNIDGTSGIITNAENIDKDGLDNIKKLNNDRLNVYAIDSLEVEFETTRGGLRAGMTMRDTYIEEEFLTEELLISEIEIIQEGEVLLYKVKAVYGPLNETWADFYIKSNESIVAGQSLETVTQIFTFTKNWLETESPNIFQNSLIIPFTVTATFGFSGFTRNRYLAWYNSSNVEMGRVKILFEIFDNQNDPTEISTIAFIPETAVGNIAFIGWIGGQAATNEINTGFILDKQPVSLNKTNLEIYQIEKTDYKW